MIEIANLEEWTKEYFSDPENQKKAEKACERYDRLMVKNIKRQLSGGAEKIFLNEELADVPGKCMEKAKYEVIPFAKVDGKKETSSGSCYLTTACMKHFNVEFDDNCYELQVLRWFRDNFVSIEDVNHYYKTAPIIVDGINKSADYENIYLDIYQNRTWTI